jgi:hypothetical protein
MSTDNTQGGAEPSPASAGSHGSASRWNGVPVAWAAVVQNGVPLCLAYHRQDAQGAVVGMAQVVPLYRSPTLTDEEREAISAAACICEDAGRTDIAVIINTALERLD